MRFWWLAAGVLLIISVYFAITHTLRWQRENRLIREGVAVQAKVLRAGTETVTGKRVAPSNSATMRFTWSGQEHQINGVLAGRKEHIVIGDMVGLRIDPDNPKTWTARTEPANLAQEMLGALLILPAVFAALIAAMLQRRAVLTTYRTGEIKAALVVDTHQTALAPMSRAVRCTLRGTGDKRVITVYVSSRGGLLQRGDLIWLITRPNNAARSLAVAAYA